MAFSSATFIFFFLPTVLGFYAAASFMTPPKRETACKLVIVLASLFFYAWATAEYVLVAVLLSAANYLLAFGVSTGPAPSEQDDRERAASSRGKPTRIAFLAFGVALNLSALVFFKYWGFLCENAFSLFGLSFDGVEAPLIQPLGISFLVFSLISYLVDTYRKVIPAERSMLNYLTWALFFPKITQGPISRYSEMFDQSQSLHLGLSLANLEYGARRFVIGLAKKVMIADVLGAMVDEIFLAQASTGVDTPTAWLGIICYTFQIFFDFSGYSDMAIGLAAMFGFRLKENFDYPYTSTTVGEFWRRWHISLSTWLRDYLYFPLGGSRRGNVYVNLAIVFILSGFWHGASWHFVAWGAWYAFFMIIDRLYRKLPPNRRLPKALSWLFTMTVVVFGWVFFRSSGMNQAFQYLALLFGRGAVHTQFFGFWYYFNPRTVCVLIFAAFASTPAANRLSKRFENTKAWSILRAVGIPVLFVIALSFVISNSYTPFLYAQF